jgi:hypothetical protein
MLGGKIDDDAEAVGDGQPRQQPSRRQLNSHPLRQQAPQLLGRAAQAIR